MSKTFIFPKFWEQFIASAKLGRASRYYKAKKYKEAAVEYHSILELSAGESTNEIVCEQLGKMYENGIGVEKDEILAEEFYFRAGTRGEGYKIHEYAIKGYTDKYK
jgi:TPR repeat protein